MWLQEHTHRLHNYVSDLQGEADSIELATCAQARIYKCVVPKSIWLPVDTTSNT